MLIKILKYYTDSLLSQTSQSYYCLLYTSDAADERSSVDLGGRRIIKKKKKQKNNDEVNIIKKNKHKLNDHTGYNVLERQSGVGDREE